MKIKSFKILALIIFVFSITNIYSQTYLISDGGTVTTCSGTLYDSGGASSDYSNNEYYSITICSSMPGATLTLFFAMFDFESPTWDHLTI